MVLKTKENKTINHETNICILQTYDNYSNEHISLQKCPSLFVVASELGFPTGRDTATFRDKGTEVSSLSQDKGTMGQGQNLFTGRAGTGF